MSGARDFSGPVSGVAAARTALAPGVWLTRGRAVVLEGRDDLAVVDPGDEPVAPRDDVQALSVETGKPLRWILITHAHPDHIGNLAAFQGLGPAKVVAHTRSPVRPDVPVSARTVLAIGSGLEAIPTPGHSSWGDDLTFWHPASRIVFSGDLVQPKGEQWTETFYPSPWAFFRDGDTYRESLGKISVLPYEILVTGHREVRTGELARRWVALTIRSIERVREAVLAWDGPDDLTVAGPAIYAQIARERGLPEERIRARLARGAGGSSAFRDFDLPGIAFYWEKRT